MATFKMQLLDTNPKWLGFTFVCSACALVVVGVGVFVNQLGQDVITPFSLLLHFSMAVSVSAWILNLRFKMSVEKKPLVAIGIVVAVGLLWSSVQQWFGYFQTGLTNDITLVLGATAMDVVGGCVTYVLFRQNILRK